MTLTLNSVRELDSRDPLAQTRKEFSLNEGEVYLDGNSLGAMPKKAAERAQEVVVQQWSRSLIQSWNSHNWVDLPKRTGEKIGYLIGAQANEVVCTESTGVNIYKAVACALQLNPDRRVIVMEGSNFPTNNYMVQGLIDQLGQGHEIRFVERGELIESLDESVAVACLTQVHYKTGEKFDLADVTAKAQAKGAVVVWDLCHSTGAFPVDVTRANVDLAVGCTYKFLNGGPGSPAYIYMASRHHNRVRQPLTGWWGHEAPFEFTRDYSPAEGISQQFTGTPSVVALSVMEPGIDLMCQTDPEVILQKSHGLTGLFIDLVEQECAGFGLELVTPRDPDKRGSQVAFRHKQGYPIIQALIAEGVIGDFRAPDILRFGFAPLYNSYEDVWSAVQRLKNILQDETWRAPEFNRRHAVT